MVDDVILVGGDWNMALIFHFIYGMSSFPLTFIFFRGVETTNQMCISQKFSQILTNSHTISPFSEKNTRCEAHINGISHLPICRR